MLYVNIAAEPWKGAVSKSNITPPDDKAQLGDTQELYTLALRATNDLIWDWDIQSGRLAWIDIVDSRFGYGRDQIEPTLIWWLDHIHPDNLAAIREHVRKIQAGGVDQFSAEYRFLKADGDYADICNRGYVVHDSAGLPVRGVGAMQDISARKQAEKALRRSEAQFRNTLDHIPQMVWATLPDGSHDYSNQLWDEFTGVRPGTTNGETWNILTHPDDQARARELWSHSLRTGEPFEV